MFQVVSISAQAVLFWILPALILLRSEFLAGHFLSPLLTENKYFSAHLRSLTRSLIIFVGARLWAGNLLLWTNQKARNPITVRDPVFTNTIYEKEIIFV